MNEHNLSVTQIANTGTGHVAYLESENHAVQVSHAYPRSDDPAPYTEGEVYTLTLDKVADAPVADTEDGTAAPGTAVDSGATAADVQGAG